MVDKWKKILARNAPLLVWVTEADALRRGIKLEGFIWRRDKDLDIRFNTPLTAVFDYNGKSEYSNLQKFIDKKNYKIEKILKTIEADIKENILLKHGKTRKDCIFLYEKFRLNMSYMLVAYYIFQNIYNKIKDMLGAKRFKKIEPYIIQPYKEPLAIREHRAIENLKVKYKMKILNKKCAYREAKKLSQRFGFFHSEYQTVEWKPKDYFREITANFNLNKKPKPEGKDNFSSISDQYIAWLVSIAQRWVYVFDEAKASQTRALWALRKTIKKLGFNGEEIIATTQYEFLNWTKNKEIPNNILERQRFFFVMLWNGKIKIKFGEEDVSRIIKKEKIKEFLSLNKKAISEIKGKIGYRGLVRGKARIVFTPKGANTIKKGEIFIASMTTPELIGGMRKASAFVTDEGGIISHAAIIAREMKKPCIIGTKIATKVLKDGDLVEVDADRGVVRILKRAK